MVINFTYFSILSFWLFLIRGIELRLACQLMYPCYNESLMMALGVEPCMSCYMSLMVYHRVG